MPWATRPTKMRHMGRPPSQLTIARANAALSTPAGAEVFLGSCVHHLDPPRAVFDAMLADFDRQQAARGLAIDTRRGRERLVRQLQAFAGFPGGPPRRRTVLTAFPWAAEIARHWIETSRVTCYPAAADVKVLFPTERGRRISPRQIDDRFAAIRDEAGLPGYLNPHCLRHTYATTLIEMGWPMALVQDQMGHAHVATTAVYTALSDDFKDRVLYRSLGMDWDDDLERPAIGQADGQAGAW